MVSTLADNEIALGVCGTVWGADSVQNGDLYYVIATHGGYFSIAWRNGVAVGASFGFLANRGRALVSHMTGVIASEAGNGVGFALKQHQRLWAREQGIETITWTYDPLVRRNGWFNLVRLGATVSQYTINYYGQLGDVINGNDESDRFEMTWPVNADVSSAVVMPGRGDVLVVPPPDIETIRRSNPNEGRRWRLQLREQLAPRLAAGWRVIGMTADYEYVLRDDRSD